MKTVYEIKHIYSLAKRNPNTNANFQEYMLTVYLQCLLIHNTHKHYINYNVKFQKSYLSLMVDPMVMIMS